jgi:NlpC/P60 family putative phage cell wall peptidase
MTRADIIAEAESWLGTPYHHQASLKGVGADCLGLVRGVWRALYGPEPLDIPAYAQDPSETAGSEPLIGGVRQHLVACAGTPRPGDLLVFRLREGLPARHCSILVAPDRFVHAVSARSVSGATFAPWWRRRLAAHFAFPDIED